MSTTQHPTRRKPRLIIQHEVREVLDEQGRSMTWLAKKLGVSRNWLYYAMSGAYAISEERVAQINDLLGTSFSLPE